jgi:DNA-binding LytR/AlgR family response regulator
MAKIAICDDEIDEAARIEEFVRAYDHCDIAVYNNSRELVWAIEDGATFDVYLLDVVMPKPDGIELARIIRRTDETAAIIYLTNHDERALDAFRVQASQYLTKPVSRETLFRELDAALTAIKTKKSQTFLLKTKDGTQALPIHRIAYCELENRAISCVTADGKKQTSITLREPFEEALASLLNDNRFIRPHVSFAVNLDYVESLKGTSLIMKTGASIPIAHRASSEIKEKYLRHFFNQEKQ